MNSQERAAVFARGALRRGLENSADKLTPGFAQGIEEVVENEGFRFYIVTPEGSMRWIDYAPIEGSAVGWD